MNVALSALAQAASHTLDPAINQPGLSLPFVAVVAAVALIVALAALLRARAEREQ